MLHGPHDLSIANACQRIQSGEFDRWAFLIKQWPDGDLSLCVTNVRDEQEFRKGIGYLPATKAEFLGALRYLADRHYVPVPDPIPTGGQKGRPTHATPQFVVQHLPRDVPGESCP